MICQYCNKEYKNKSTLSSHITQKHPAKTAEEKERRKQNKLSGLQKGLQPTNCPICNTTCKTPRALYVHNIMNHAPGEEKEMFIEQKRKEQKEKMKDPELKTKMLSGLKNYKQTDEQKQKSSIRFKKLRKEHPEWDRLGAEAYSKKIKELFPRTEFDYPLEWNNELKKIIKNRDGWKCIDCDISANELKKLHRRLAVHHLDLNKQNLQLDNLVTLCYICHMKRHHVIRQKLLLKEK